MRYFEQPWIRPQPTKPIYSMYAPCVFNKQDPVGAQITALMHVDDLFITSTGSDNHTRFEKCMRDKYMKIKITTGKVVEYIGITFDFIVPRQVSITMDNCECSIISECGVWLLSVTRLPPPFLIHAMRRKATYEEVQFFRTFVAKLLYLAKRVRPECQVAVAFSPQGYMTSTRTTLLS